MLGIYDQEDPYGGLLLSSMIGNPYGQSAFAAGPGYQPGPQYGGGTQGPSAGPSPGRRLHKPYGPMMNGGQSPYYGTSITN